MTKARDIASATTPNANAALLATFPHRNLIINGAMQVAQRGTSNTITTSGVFTSDRFKVTKGNTDELVATLTQDTSAPSGFSNSTKITVNTAETAVAADESLNCRYEIEARDLQGIANGTSNAKSLTLSFWVKSSVTGTYTVALYKNDNTSRLITSTYTISTANTWEQKTLTFAGDTSGGGINNDSGSGLSIVWWLTVGANKTGTNSTSWINYVEGGYAYGHTADIASTASATWQITGVQLEVGDTATPFEHRSYADELARCQRYYYRIGDAGGGFYATGFISDPDDTYFDLSLPCSMRIDAPTISYANVVIYTSAGTETSFTINNWKANGASLYLNCDSTTTPWSTGQASSLFVTATTGWLAADAEL